ncbi:MAG: hypothetical protein WBD69_07415 [Candidatus Cybelea sp.]
MKPSDKLAGSRVWKRSFGCEFVDAGLYANVRGGLFLKIAPRLVSVKLARQRAHDFRWSRIVPLDEIAVVGIHDAHEFSQAGGRPRMERPCKARRGGRDFCNKVGNARRGKLEQGRLNPLRVFKEHFGRNFIGHCGLILLYFN